MKFSKESFQALGKSLSKAKALKNLSINQTNLASFLPEFIIGFSENYTLEFLNLQSNDLNDSHAQYLARIISAQFELKD